MVVGETHHFRKPPDRDMTNLLGRHPHCQVVDASKLEGGFGKELPWGCYHFAPKKCCVSETRYLLHKHFDPCEARLFFLGGRYDHFVELKGEETLEKGHQIL